MRRMTLLAGGPVDKNTFFEAFQIDLKTDYKREASRSNNDRDSNRDFDRNDRNSNRDDRNDRDFDRNDRNSTNNRSGGDVEGVYDSLRGRLERHPDVQKRYVRAEDLLKRALERCSMEREVRIGYIW